MVYVTISKAREKELTHYLTFSELVLARSFLKGFDFNLVQEDNKPPTDSFWIHHDSKLIALIWLTPPRNYKE